MPMGTMGRSEPFISALKLNILFGKSEDRKSGKANKLEPGQTYAMYVEHAIFTDTQNDFGMPGFATLASSTYMDFQTLGITDPNYCARDSK